MTRKRFLLLISTVFLILFSLVPGASSEHNDVQCAGINRVTQTLGYETKQVDDNVTEVFTDEGSIYLEENTSSCSYVLLLVFANGAAIADLDFVNKQNVENRFGFLTLQDENLVFENHVLMPDENEFLFKVYFHMFKREADKINANLKKIVDAHKKIEREYQRLKDGLANANI